MKQNFNAMKLLGLLFLPILMGCSAPSGHVPAQTAQEPVMDANYRVPDNPEPGQLDGKQIIVSPMHTAEEGTYFLDMGFSATILELKGGHFRYWFATDTFIKGEHQTQYPVTGYYSLKDATVRLEHKEGRMEDVWTFRKMNGETTLWRPSAVKNWHDSRIFDPYGVLRPTSKKPEQLWIQRLTYNKLNH